MYILEFQQYGPTLKFDVIVLGPSLDAKTRNFTLRWRSADEPKEKKTRLRMRAGPRTGFVFSDQLIGYDDPEALIEENSGQAVGKQLKIAENSVEGIFLDGNAKPAVALLTGPLHQAFEAMRSCVDDLVVSWGFDPVALRNQQRGPVPLNYSRIVRKVTDRYPTWALQRGQDGALQISLFVDETGTPTSCLSQFDFKPKEFAETACRELMSHAKFEPAKSADGTKAKGIWHTSIVYVAY